MASSRYCIYDKTNHEKNRKICPRGCSIEVATANANGYPENEKEVIVGFKNADHLESFVKNHPYEAFNG